jgi:hypothetical protein
MLTKQGIDISFAQGLDTKTDPKRVPIGKFRVLENRVFSKDGLLQKRYGYAQLASLPDTTYSYLTTFSGNLTAIGPSIAARNDGGDSWVSKGAITPLSLSTLPVIRNNLNQTSADTAIAPNGAACTVYQESDGTTTTAKYVVYDSVTGQNLSAPAAIPVSSGVVTGGLRVFVLGNNFVIVFTNVITAVSHLQYVTVNIYTPSTVGANTDIAAAYIAASSLSWDGVVVGENLYIAYNTTTGGQAIKFTYLTRGLTLASAVTFATYKATIMSVTAANATSNNPAIWASFYRSDTSVGYTLAVDQNLNTVLAPTQFITTGTYVNLATCASSSRVFIFAQRQNAYSWTANLPADYIQEFSVVLASGALSTFQSFVGVGLASKAVYYNSNAYYMASYSSPYQSTYFLVDGTASRAAAPRPIARLAYQNGGGYLTSMLPSLTFTGNVAATSYLFKDLITSVNKNTAPPTGSQTAGIYSQTGVNLARFAFGSDALNTAEIGNDLNISGGLTWMYDGYLPVEQNFLLYPDTDQTTITNNYAWSATGGSMKAQPDGSTNTAAYWYIYTYEWSDNQGNAFRSAPSIPFSVTTTGALSTGSVTLKIPYLRATMKTANPVKICVYRWSVAQQNYYQTTSITAPQQNDTTNDTLTFVDTNSDATILGNNLLYTTGGVVENVAPPGCDVMALFDTRLWLVDAEDRNLLWFSKQVIEATPVEMSDLFTVYVPPTTSTAGSTGPITGLFPMDDKLIIAKENALLYINGSGPDNTGANNQYSPPIFITATVGCTNQRSFVLSPAGLMFQSNKGIWLLDRGLGTKYIGAAVEDFTTGATVNSAVLVPGTNQVRFTLSSGITLMYDYYFDQWGTFTGVPAVSSCIFEDMHTFINDSGAVYQESAGAYLDGSRPVAQKFTTGPIRLGDLQNYQRIYFFYLLGEFQSPCKMQVSITYDYEAAPSQSFLITPDNYSTPFGGSDASDTSQSPFGQQAVFGGPSRLMVWRVFPERQRCMAFSITLEEIFDASYGIAAGAGFTLSGINALCGFKKPFRPQPAAQSIG